MPVGGNIQRKGVIEKFQEKQTNYNCGWRSAPGLNLDLQLQKPYVIF